MDLKEHNILFFTRTMRLGGTENVILQLCEIFKPLVKSITVCSCGGVNVDKLIKMGIKHYTIPDIENKNPLVAIKTLSVLNKAIKNEHISVIHTHHRMAAFYTQFISKKNIQIINTSHTVFFNKKLLTRFAFRNISLVACGDNVKRNLVNDFGFDEAGIEVIRNAVSAFDNVIKPVEQLNEYRNEGFFLVGCVARLSKEKGVDCFLRAISKLSLDSVKYIVVGDGKEEANLKALAVELGINDKVLFLGYRNDVQNVMSQLDLLVLSSYQEGLPLTPIEAFSVGKCVIGTNVGGTPEVILNGENGVIVQPNCPDELALAIKELVENNEMRTQYETTAYKTYINEFSYQVFSKNYVNYYNKVLSRKS